MKKYCIFEKSQNRESEIGSSATANLVHIALDHSRKAVRDTGDAYMGQLLDLVVPGDLPGKIII